MACQMWQLAATRDKFDSLVLPCHIGKRWVAKGSSCLPPGEVWAVGKLQAGADSILVAPGQLGGSISRQALLLSWCHPHGVLHDQSHRFQDRLQPTLS